MTLALTCRTSILLPSIYISPAAPIAMRIAAFSVTSAVSESGLFISKPGSLIKFAVTIKKIRRMNTTSNIGVMFGSSFSSTAWLISDLLIMFYSKVKCSCNKSDCFFAFSSRILEAKVAGMAAISPAIAGMVDFATPPAIALASPPPVTAKI